MNPSEAKSRLDQLGIDWYCERIIAGKSMTAVAKSAGVSFASLWRWLHADSERARISAHARELSAEAYVDRAEDAILRARTPLALSKARELAHHFRWKASKIAPRDFGDKAELVGVGGTALIPDPYRGMTKDQWELDCAKRIAFILRRGAQSADRLKAER